MKLLVRIFVISLTILLTVGQNNNTVVEYPIVKKCVCDYNQAWDNSKCVNTSMQTFRFWDGTDETVVMVSDLEPFIIVEPLLECPENMTKVHDQSHSFFIDFDGFLLSPEGKTKSYCLDNVIVNGTVVGQIAEFCIDRTLIPLCCPIEQVFTHEGTCSESNIDKESPLHLWLNQSHFEREIRELNCSSEEIQGPFQLQITDSILDFIQQLKNLESFSNGSFCVSVQAEEETFYAGGYFCSSSGDRETKQYRTIVPHCCALDETFSLQNNTCIKTSESFDFPSSIEWPLDGDAGAAVLNCTAGYSLLTLDDRQFVILQDGSLQAKDSVTKSLPFHKYCLGSVLIGENITHSGLQCIYHDIQHNVRFLVQQICLSISSIFIIITLIVYIGVPDLRRKIGGFCLISELISLLVSHITLIILLNPDPLQLPNAGGCQAAGIIILIFTLASFFWLNVMCYDVWSTFRKFRPFSEKITKTKVMLKYSSYGWGLPLLLGAIALLCEHLDTGLRPNFTLEGSCFFSVNDLAAQWVFMYGIILVLLLINMGFFVHLAIIMKPCKQSERTNLFQQNTQGNNQNKPSSENIKLHLKLFIIMGLPWIIDVCTSLVPNDTMNYIWFLDIMNMLRGIFIFFIFVCKESTRKQIISTWFPRYENRRNSDVVSQDPTRKTSMMSLSSILPGRKVSKASLASGITNMHLETVQEK